MKKIVALLALVAIVVGNSSCERILDFKADTTSQIPADSAIVTIEDAEQLLVSVYDVAANAFNGPAANRQHNSTGINRITDGAAFQLAELCFSREFEYCADADPGGLFNNLIAVNKCQVKRRRQLSRWCGPSTLPGCGRVRWRS